MKRERRIDLCRQNFVPYHHVLLWRDLIEEALDGLLLSLLFWIIRLQIPALQGVIRGIKSQKFKQFNSKLKKLREIHLQLGVPAI
jgi:hypothetical protein